MKNSMLIFVVVCLSINQTIFAQDKGIGTKEEAREILDRTVNLMKSNKTVAFAMITAGVVEEVLKQKTCIPSVRALAVSRLLTRTVAQALI